MVRIDGGFEVREGDLFEDRVNLGVGDDIDGWFEVGVVVVMFRIIGELLKK